jgi:signal transduction histidine kinase
VNRNVVERLEAIKRMKWRAFVVLLALASLSAVFWALRDITVNVPKRTYRIGFGEDFPFQFKNDQGTPTGIAVEIVREAARRRGIQLEWIATQHAGMAAILEREADLWVLLTDRPDRRNQIYITEPYLINERCFLVLRKGRIHSQKDLSSARLGYRAFWGKSPPPSNESAAFSNADETYLKQQFPHATLTPVAYGNITEVPKALKERSVDAALINKSLLGALLFSGGNREDLEVVSAPDAIGRLSLGASFASTVAAQALRDEIEAMDGDGTLTRIADQWGSFSAVSLGVIEELSAVRRANHILIAGIAALAVAIVVIGLLAMRLRRERNIGLRLSDKLLSTQEEERSRIARDLHDDLGQRVAGLSIGLSNLKRLMGKTGEKHYPQVDQLSEQVSTVAESLRTMSHSLHPATLQYAGLVPSLQTLCREITDSTGLNISMEADTMPGQIPDQVALCLYRVAQEALQNVTRHSGANEAVVRMEVVDQALQLSVSDSGRGFAASSRNIGGLGIISMKERVKMLNGTLNVETQPDRGTKVLALVPLGGRVAL